MNMPGNHMCLLRRRMSCPIVTLAKAQYCTSEISTTGSSTPSITSLKGRTSRGRGSGTDTQPTGTRTLKKEPNEACQIELPYYTSLESIVAEHTRARTRKLTKKLQNQLAFWKEVDEYLIICIFLYTVITDSIAVIYSFREDKSGLYNPSDYYWYLIYAIASNTVSIFVLICEKLYEKKDGAKRFAKLLLWMRRLFAFATFCHVSCGLYYVAVFLGMPDFVKDN